VSYRALQGGSRRRPLRPERHRRRRRFGFSLLGLVVLVAVLLGLMAARASGPTTIITPPQPSHPLRTTGLRGQYGTTLAPSSEQVNLRLTRGLQSGMLFDVQTGEILWERSPTRVLPIASLTKMMTAVVVLAHSRPDDRVLITPAAVHFSGSGIGLLPVRKRVPELALLYGLLLPSGNDAAIALADHVAGSEQRLIAMMNVHAQELGLSCTHFTTVSGIVDQGNHSCAEDLAVMAHLVLTQPLLTRIVASRSAILPFPIKGGKLYLYNNNPLLITGYPGADGVKTGYTDASGPCLVATARRGRTWLGVVLLHSEDTLDQAERLLNAGFAKLKGRT
jgi:serine-type D-Ala-D-Ala carboxypeptidase (penicillin-binding protein 5/6)